MSFTSPGLYFLFVIQSQVRPRKPLCDSSGCGLELDEFVFDVVADAAEAELVALSSDRDDG